MTTPTVHDLIGQPLIPATVDDYEHPSWCDLDRCRPHSHFPDQPAGGQHNSTGTMLPLGGCHVTTFLRHSDDLDPRTGKDVESTRVVVRIKDVECGTGQVEVNLDPGDVRLLLEVLSRYGDDASHLVENPHLMALRLTAAELRGSEGVR